MDTVVLAFELRFPLGAVAQVLYRAIPTLSPDAGVS